MNSKVCTRCEKRKNLDDFAWKNKSKETKSSWCKECFRASYRDRYANDPKEKERVMAKSRQNKIENKEKIIEYLKNNPCVDCGESDPIVLEFDHKEVIGGKGKRIPHFLSRSWARVAEEIKKCEIRCANCHTRRTARQMGWYRQGI